MGFRDLFKVRRPGNGEVFEKRVANARKTSMAVPSKDNSQNSSGKKEVK